MFMVIYALIPGALASMYFFGWGVLFNLFIAISTCLLTEAAILQLRGREVYSTIQDGSALLTACLLALALPSLAPWWITVIASISAIAVAKHLYGGLGFNPFNPAMVGYIVVMISFPLEMTLWIVIESMLTFLGLGIAPPTPSWGSILADGKNLMMVMPSLVVLPVLAIFFTVLSINLAAALPELRLQNLEMGVGEGNSQLVSANFSMTSLDAIRGRIEISLAPEKIDANILLFVVNAILIGTAIFSYYIQTL